MRAFGIDPGSTRTGYGCVDTDGRRHRLVCCGAIHAAAAGAFADRLAVIYRELSRIIRECQPECVAIEDLFHATNVRSALKLGHARGVAMLAAVEAGVPLFEYTPAEVKRAVVGYGRAEKPQVQQMIKLLLGLDRPPEPHDAADALAVAICHLHASGPMTLGPAEAGPRGIKAGSRGMQAGPSGGKAGPDGMRDGDRRVTAGPGGIKGTGRGTGLQRGHLRSWRQYKPA